MEMIKVKFVLAMLIGNFLLPGNTYSYTKGTELHLQDIQCTVEGNGYIVMEDDVMLVDTEDASDPIMRIEVFSDEDEKVLDIGDVFVSQHSVDLRDLLPGRYLVNVYTAQQSFSSFVNVK